VNVVVDDEVDDVVADLDVDHIVNEDKVDNVVRAPIAMTFAMVVGPFGSVRTATL